MYEKQNINYFFTDKTDGNLAFHVDDIKEDVIQNHQRLSIKHNYNYLSLVYMKQVHSNKVHIVTDKDNFLNPPTTDALITDKIATPLMVMVADCTPIIFYDKVKNIIAVAHAGRSGAFYNIIENVIKSFTNDFHSNISDIKVIIGVSISKKCYEVSQDIYDEAKNLNLEYAIEDKNGKYTLDIKQILLKQLHHTGILKHNIINKDICNCCNTSKYFSFRKEKQTGRYAGVIYIES